MFNQIMHSLLKNSDEYAKILIIVWMKLREIYLESSKNDNVSLNKRIQSLEKFCRTIRKRCDSAKKLPKLSRFLARIEHKCANGKETLEKLSSITTMLRMFDLPKPVNNLIDSLGLGSMEDNEFANVINELFEENDELHHLKEIDDNNEEGTLVDYINRKYEKSHSKKLEKKFVKVDKKNKNQPLLIEKLAENHKERETNNVVEKIPLPDNPLLKTANLYKPSNIPKTIPKNEPVTLITVKNNQLSRPESKTAPRRVYHHERYVPPVATNYISQRLPQNPPVQMNPYSVPYQFTSQSNPYNSYNNYGQRRQQVILTNQQLSSL